MFQKEIVSGELFLMLERLSGENIFEGFTLGGRTALALQLGHRKSDDLDFFTYKDFKKRRNKNG
jgi:hypothetical protein